MSEHPLMKQMTEIAKMRDRSAAAALRDALLADMAALGAPQAVRESAKRIMDNCAQ